MNETKPVPEPNEADRDDDEVHYYDVDETNVSETDEQDTQDEDDE